ncbi:hypothetical protein HJC23_005252 [Cyclotella cryptica]|uniref:Uncharacterized protein n=1 Tax=Cyclotella cryptica TaxID=29204 RepID=A0ABD3PKQ3_9STRA|eukprot:CCRYP_013608-RA/>CCRYP_013608-RA protein AED:0.25 eAED:0.25 QI:86/-1/1/1/-1/1/1/340/268
MSMSDARSQLAEIEALIAASPDDPSLQALKDDLLQLIALEEQASEVPSALHSLPAAEQQQQHPPTGASSVDVAAVTDQQSTTILADYTAQGKFTSHETSLQSSLLEAPDISAFQPVTTSSKGVASRTATESGDVDDLNAIGTNNNQTETKKKKKKKKEESEMKFELPPHLIPLDSDTPAQKLKKQRTAKALKSKFREKQKELEADKKKNDWKSFAKGGKRKAVGGIVGNSIFSTEEGVNAKVGVVSGGGTRKMTEFSEKGGNKRHKFL